MSLKISNSLLSGTALRCIPFHHTNPGLRPGLTENGSALRTTNHVDLLLKTKATAKVRFLRDSGSVAEATAEGRLYKSRNIIFANRRFVTE